MTSATLHLIARAGFVATTLGVMAVVALPLRPNPNALPEEPRANRFCILSLLLVLAMVLAAGIAQFELHFLQDAQWKTSVTGAILAGLSFSAILGVIGLSQVLGHETVPLQTGKKRAIVALSLVCILCAGIGFGVFRIKRPPVVQELPSAESPDHRFRITLVPPWEEVPVKVIDPAASVALFRSPAPSVTFSVIVTPPKDKLVETFKRAVERAKARLQKTASKVKVDSEGPTKIGELNAVQVCSEVELRGKPFHYLQWVFISRGYTYELNAWAYASIPVSDVIKATLPVLNHFEFTTSATSAHKSAPKAQDYASPISGFTVKLEGTDWTQVASDLYKNFPAAEWGVRTENGRGFFGIIPLPLGSDHDPDITVLSHVFLWPIGVESLKESVHDLKTVLHGPLNGVAFNFERMSTPDISYHAEVLKGNGFAYLLLGCFNKDPDAESKLSNVFARVKFDPAPEQPSTDSFTTMERQIRASYLREIGREYSKINRYQFANEYYKEARAMEPETVSYIQVAAEALIATGDLTAARDYLKAHIPGSGDDGRLQVRLAWLQAQTGDTAAALDSYQSAFALHLRDDASFADYVTLLAKTGDTDRALGAAESYLKDHDCMEVRLAEAAVYRRLKQLGPALDILRAQQDLYPDKSEIRVNIAALYLALDQYKEALDECNALLKTGNSTALVHYFKGRCELGLKHYTEARASLEEALRQNPESADTRALLDKASSAEHSVK